jgi:hypothetical protein
MDQIIREYFNANPLVNKVKAKELNPIFIERCIFFKKQRDGLPICNLLHQLDKDKRLDLFKHIHAERDPTNKNWYFTVDKPGMICVN